MHNSQPGRRGRSTASRVADHVHLLRAYVRDPRRTGAVAPSSRWLAARMTEGMRLGAATCVVEVGAGTGSFTPSILRAMRPRARLLVVELNRELAGRLRARFRRADVIRGSVEHLPRFLSARGCPAADAVVSSLPWTTLTRPLQEKLLRAIAGSMRPGARFSTYVYVHSAWMPGAARFRRLLRRTFRKVRRTPVVLRNIPPAFVYRCEK
ncbi:MAG: methyltransferase domain-containing protein [Candidatus Coatesbacteria bacterium]